MTNDHPQARATALLAAWAARVRANREQVDRIREKADGDFYAPVAQRFRFDPLDPRDPVLPILEMLVRSDDVVIDIGAGGGRYALPLARRVRRVIGVEPSPAMLGTLRAGIAQLALNNVTVVEAEWPLGAAGPTGDVAMIANVGHDVEDIGTFVDAMEQAAARLCVAVMMELPPPHEIDLLWPAIHGEARVELPALPDLLALLRARGRRPEVRIVELPAADPDLDARQTRARRLLWIRPDGEKDRLLRQVLASARPLSPRRTGIVTWSPRSEVPVPLSSYRPP